jgi:hypothetical protein
VENLKARALIYMWEYNIKTNLKQDGRVLAEYTWLRIRPSNVSLLIQ